MIDNKKATHLILPYYQCDGAERQAEIDTCLRNNLQNPHLAAIHLLTEEEFDFSNFPNNGKIIPKVIGQWLTFEQAFCYANEADSSGENFWILSNADIYFDESLSYLQRVNLDGVVLALTRHDVLNDGSVRLVDEAYAHGCQDAWIFKTPINAERIYTKFRMGIPGCDNRLAYEFLKNDFVVANPSKTIRCLHLDLTREVDIARRTAEYVRLHTKENFEAGAVAPPPWQFYIYPVSDLGFDNLDVYKCTGKMQLELTRLNGVLATRDKYIVELNNLVQNHAADMNNMEQRHAADISNMKQVHATQIEAFNKNTEDLNHTITALLNSLSWRITSPLRKVATILKRLRDLVNGADSREPRQ